MLSKIRVQVLVGIALISKLNTLLSQPKLCSLATACDPLEIRTQNESSNLVETIKFAKFPVAQITYFILFASLLQRKINSACFIVSLLNARPCLLTIGWIRLNVPLALSVGILSRKSQFSTTLCLNMVLSQSCTHSLCLSLT